MFSVIPWSPVLFAILVGVWSSFGWAFMAPQQSRLVAIAPAVQALALALNAAMIYVGIAIGSGIGSTIAEMAGASSPRHCRRSRLGNRTAASSGVEQTRKIESMQLDTEDIHRKSDRHYYYDSVTRGLLGAGRAASLADSCLWAGAPSEERHAWTSSPRSTLSM